MPRCQIDLILVKFLLFDSLSASRFALCLLGFEESMTELSKEVVVVRDLGVVSFNT